MGEAEGEVEAGEGLLWEGWIGAGAGRAGPGVGQALAAMGQALEHRAALGRAKGLAGASQAP